MASARRWSVSGTRTVISAILTVVAAFLLFISLGAGNWVLAALGAALLAAAVAFYTVAALNSREFAYVPGTAHVVSCSPPPAANSQGRCEMQLVVHAPGMSDQAVKIRDAGVPVSKWPDAGSTLPILVAVNDPRRVRVLWDNVRSHGEVAEGRIEPAYAGEETEPDPYLGGLLDEEYEERSGPVEVDRGGQFLEMDLMDPALFHGDEEDEDAGPGYSSSISFDPDIAMSPGVQLDRHVDLAAPEPDEVQEQPEEVPEERPEPDVRTRPRPSPRPRRPLDDLPAGEPDPDTGGGVATLPARSVPERDPSSPPLQVEQLVAADPGVPGMTDTRAAADTDVSDAYLAVARPPGSPRARVRGVGVTLFVTRLGRSLAFYRDLLGFRQVDLGLGSAVLESGDARIVLRRVADMPPVDRRLIHLLLEVPDVQAAYDELLLQGVEFVHRPRVVSRYEELELWSATFRDPDGHGIALTRWDVQRAD